MLRSRNRSDTAAERISGHVKDAQGDGDQKNSSPSHTHLNSLKNPPPRFPNIWTTDVPPLKTEQKGGGGVRQIDPAWLSVPQDPFKVPPSYLILRWKEKGRKKGQFSPLSCTGKRGLSTTTKKNHDQPRRKRQLETFRPLRQGNRIRAFFPASPPPLPQFGDSPLLVEINCKLEQYLF